MELDNLEKKWGGKYPYAILSWRRNWDDLTVFFQFPLEIRNTIYVCASCGNGCYHDLVGAHVQKVNSNDKKWYIVPLCKSCNQKNEPFNVDDDMLVPVPSNM